MRLVATEYLSLDGIFEEPGHWSFPYFDESAAQFKFDELQHSDALLLGRNTYEGFAAAWPTMEGTGEFGEKMNTMPKYVVSSRLRSADWAGSQIVDGEPVAAVAELKQKPGQDLLLSGSGQLFNTLLEAGLIDLYRFMIFPICLGQGKRLFRDSSRRQPLRLTAQRATNAGVLIVEYEPAAES